MALRTSGIIIPEEIVIQKVENESVIINLLTEEYYSLDEISTHIWDAITSAPSVQEATEKLSSEFEVDQDQLEQDVFRLIQELEDFGLISRTP